MCQEKCLKKKENQSLFPYLIFILCNLLLPEPKVRLHFLRLDEGSSILFLDLKSGFSYFIVWLSLSMQDFLMVQAIDVMLFKRL